MICSTILQRICWCEIIYISISSSIYHNDTSGFPFLLGGVVIAPEIQYENPFIRHCLLFIGYWLDDKLDYPVLNKSTAQQQEKKIFPEKKKKKGIYSYLYADIFTCLLKIFTPNCIWNDVDKSTDIRKLFTKFRSNFSYCQCQNEIDGKHIENLKSKN